MASRYWGMNRGQHQVDVVEQATTPGKDLEIKYDLTKNIPQAELIQDLQEMVNYIIAKLKWPPA